MSRATAREITDHLARFRFNFADEDQLQEALADALAQCWEVEREVVLPGHGRIDMLVDDSIGIEVKVQGATAAVWRQCKRYLRSDRLDGLVLVTTRLRHTQLGRERVGDAIKPFYVLTIAVAGL